MVCCKQQFAAAAKDAALLLLHLKKDCEYDGRADATIRAIACCFLGLNLLAAVTCSSIYTVVANDIYI